MSMRVGSDWWEPLPVHRGVPQGSILGVFLFNVAVDNLEDGCPDTGEDTLEPRRTADGMAAAEREAGRPVTTSSPLAGMGPLTGPDLSPIKVCWRRT